MSDSVPTLLDLFVVVLRGDKSSPDAGLAALCRKFCSLKILPSLAPYGEKYKV